jgi:hypothetical protein
MARTGTANLPLHGGRVPTWLSSRMAKLGRVITEAIVIEYGRDELLRRLAHPFWFQSFGCVMGMDWHSSGITTSVLGALKRGLAPVQAELGVYVCGGRGRHSRKTPDELRAVGERVGLDGEALARTSKLVAKVDSAAVQDGYDLYLHGFIVTDDGHWTVVQQGMAPAVKQARRYHWLGEGVQSFVEEPHAAIEGRGGGTIVNLTDRRAGAARAAQVELVASPDRVLDELERLPRLSMPDHHDVRPSDVLLRRMRGTLAAAASAGPADFPELLLQPGIGARTVRALALVAEVVHGAPSRFTDPARFTLAHGGKDRHPFPVPLHVYDRTIGTMRSAIEQARLGNDERLAALRRLDEQARLLERAATNADFDAVIEEEEAHTAEWGGRSVLGEERPKPKQQLALALGAPRVA